MQTEKDAEIVDWIGRLGAAGAEHVMGRFGVGRSWAYARLYRLVADGLLEQRTLLYRTPGLYEVLSERELRIAESDTGELLASKRVGPGEAVFGGLVGGLVGSVAGSVAGEALEELEEE